MTRIITHILLFSIVIFFINCSKPNEWIVTGEGLRIRTEPNLKSKIIGKLNKGDIIKEIYRTQKYNRVYNRNAPWLLIEFNNLKGWVFGGYLSLYKASIEFQTDQSDCNFGNVFIKNQSKLFQKIYPLTEHDKNKQFDFRKARLCEKVDNKNILENKYVLIQIESPEYFKAFISMKDLAFPEMKISFSNFQTDNFFYYNDSETCHTLIYKIVTEKNLIIEKSFEDCEFKGDKFVCDEGYGEGTFFGGTYLLEEDEIIANISSYHGNSETGILYTGRKIPSSRQYKIKIFRCGVEAVCSDNNEPLFMSKNL